MLCQSLTTENQPEREAHTYSKQDVGNAHLPSESSVFTRNDFTHVICDEPVYGSYGEPVEHSSNAQHRDAVDTVQDMDQHFQEYYRYG
jgi:hypothetical protein